MLTKNNTEILKSVWTHLEIVTGNGVKNELSSSEHYRLRISEQLEPVKMENGELKLYYQWFTAVLVHKDERHDKQIEQKVLAFLKNKFNEIDEFFESSDEVLFFTLKNVPTRNFPLNVVRAIYESWVDIIKFNNKGV